MPILFQISKYRNDWEIREDVNSQKFYYGLDAILFRESLLHLHPNIHASRGVKVPNIDFINYDYIERSLKLVP